MCVMDIVKSIIELQINCHVYNNLYNCNRELVIEKLKPTLVYLNATELSANTLNRIIDGIVKHPINKKSKQPHFTDKNEIVHHMRYLCGVINIEYYKYSKRKTSGKHKKAKSHLYDDKLNDVNTPSFMTT